jgi:integrase
MGKKRRHHRNLPENMRLARGAYYLTAYIDGKQKWLPLGKEPAQAFAEYARLTAYSEPAGKTVSELVDRYVREVLPTLKPKSQASYKSWLKAIVKTWGHMPVRAIRQPDAAVYLDTYPDKVSANRHVSLLGTLLRKGKRWGWLETLHLDGIELNDEKRRERIISQDEWAKILKAASPEMNLLLRFLRFTALRKGDLCRLTWASIKDERLIVRTSKTGSPVSFQLAGELGAIVSALKGRQGKFPKLPLFPGPRGKAWRERALDDAWYAVRKAAGVEGVTLHDIRRTRITELVERHGSEFAQRVATHKDPRMTERYNVPQAVLIDWPELEIRDR